MTYLTLKSVLLLCQTLALMLALLPSSGNTEQTQLIFRDKMNRVEFLYSDQFVIEPLALPEVVVALKSKADGLPSFNIISIAEGYSPDDLSSQDFEDRILSDYRKVGYTEAIAIGTKPLIVAGQSVLSTEIRFETNNGLLSAHVTLLPNGQNSHLILTYMNRVDVADADQEKYRDIIKSLKLPEYHRTDVARTPTEADKEPINYWTTLAILVGLGIALGLARRSLRASSERP